MNSWEFGRKDAGMRLKIQRGLCRNTIPLGSRNGYNEVAGAERWGLREGRWGQGVSSSGAWNGYYGLWYHESLMDTDYRVRPEKRVLFHCERLMSKTEGARIKGGTAMPCAVGSPMASRYPCSSWLDDVSHCLKMLWFLDHIHPHQLP